MQVGFSVLCRGEDITIHRFGQSASSDTRPALVTWAQTPGYTAVLMGRLYYQEALNSSLHSLPSVDDCNDAALALAAYRRYGEAGISRLEGDFALAIWDANKNRLLACRDPMGGYPLFWMERTGLIAFSTSLRPLLDLLPQRTLNLDYVADFLMLPGTDAQQLAGEDCAFQGIRRIGAGSLARVKISNGRVEQRTFWHWPEQLVEPDTDRLEVLGEQFADLMRQAVRERLCGPTAFHLSGGMDSTAVALMARQWVSAGHGHAPLHTLSLVYEQLPDLARERTYIESVLQKYPDVTAHRIPADRLLNFNDFADPPPHDEPWTGLPWLGTGRALINCAAQAGMSSILTGAGADQILEVLPFYLTDLVRRGHLYTAWQSACQFARANTCNPWTVFYPFGLANLLPVWLRAGMGTHFRRGYAPWKDQNEHTIAPWILPGFARRHALRSRAIDHIRQTYQVCRSTQLSVSLSMITRRNGDWNRWYLAAPLGMTIAHPYLDPRVVSFSLGALNHLTEETHHKKPLLAEAMRGVLPDTIRNRHRKGSFNEPYFLGLSHHLPALEALIRQAPTEDLELFDKEVLVQCLHQAALGITSGTPALSRLNLTLSFIKWLCMQDEWRRSAKPPSEIIQMHPRSATSARRNSVHMAPSCSV